MPFKSSIASIIPSSIAFFVSFPGSGFWLALLVAGITKLILYFFDKEIKKIAFKARKFIDKLRE